MNIPRVNYHEYILYSPIWKAKRIAILIRANRCCQRCGRKAGLHVHHKTYKRLGYERLDDLIALCRRCHRDVHRKWTRPQSPKPKVKHKPKYRAKKKHLKNQFKPIGETTGRELVGIGSEREPEWPFPKPPIDSFEYAVDKEYRNFVAKNRIRPSAEVIAAIEKRFGEIPKTKGQQKRYWKQYRRMMRYAALPPDAGGTCFSRDV